MTDVRVLFSRALFRLGHRDSYGMAKLGPVPAGSPHLDLNYPHFKKEDNLFFKSALCTGWPRYLTFFYGPIQLSYVHERLPNGPTRPNP